MTFNKIDIDTWDRKKIYNHYKNDIPCTYSMSVNIEVTQTLKTCKLNNVKFFPTFLYCISSVINSQTEFRMSFNSDGELGYYNVSNPCFTVFNTNTKLFANLWTEYNADFNIFYSSYLDDITWHKENSNEDKPNLPNSTFNVSAIPWVSFTAFNLNLQKGYDYLSPIFTIGKYYEQNNKIYIPLAIQVNHMICDGYHISLFINELQHLCNEFKI